MRQRFFLFDFVEKCDRASQMRYYDGTANSKCHTEHLKQFFFGYTSLGALEEMIGYTIVAAEDHRRNKSQHLFCLRVEFPGFIRECIDPEKAFDSTVVRTQDPLVHRFTKSLKIIEAVTHRSMYVERM